MSKVLAITSGKGGVGKSSLSIAIASCLASLNNKVLLIDLDAGLRSLDLMFGAADKCVFDISDILTGKCDVSKAVITSEYFESLNLICGPSDSEFKLDRKIFMDFIKCYKEKFDYIVLDTPAGLGNNVKVAVSNATDIFFVVPFDPVSVRDAEKASIVLEKEITAKRGINQSIIINRVPKILPDFPDLEDLDSVIDQTGLRLMGVVPFDIDFSINLSSGKKPDFSNIAVKTTLNIANRIIGKRVPLLIK